ncbi:MAG: D-aminoacylase [Bacteroidetes bacterium]|nr:D-aminoacylase [Bacteroidota bacterium]MBS1541977.1 D-aminoacylase [Bacteroidota bacterium]
MKYLLYLFLFIAVIACKKQSYDIIIRHGTVYDGTGKPGVMADIGINADTIAFVGDLKNAVGKNEIDATGVAVSPGFVNMMSHAETSLLIDSRLSSDLRQGITLEVLGESSMGPLSDQMKKEAIDYMKKVPDWAYNIDWTTLGEYLQSLEKRKFSPNVASFVGANTIRIHELGYANRAPNKEELEHMKALVKQAMEEGAMGITTALIYAPDNYASTDELIELSKVAAQYGGIYISHIRSEGNNIFAAVDETIRIAREAGLPAEIYHLKMAGKDNWWKLDTVIAKIDKANKQGYKITADMYTYTAGATGLDASMPPWVQEGGINEWIRRLKNPAIKKKVLEEMRTPTDKWENMLRTCGGPENVLFLSFAKENMKKYVGKTLAEVSKEYKLTPEETVIQLVIDDSTRVETAYFMMSEENIKRQIQLPYVSFGSDAGAPAAEGMFLKYKDHPRAYGNFARLLAKYVRDEKVIPLEEAIRKLTSLPCGNLKIKKRGQLSVGYFADVVVFDPATIQDHATFENPHQYSTGVQHVWVNGTQVIKNGEHTGEKPGRLVRGPGWKK